MTGKKVSPPLFESMDVLGRQEVLRRVENATRALQQGYSNACGVLSIWCVEDRSSM